MSLNVEWFDCPNDCKVSPLNVTWYKGDAFCPECGEMGCVYSREIGNYVRTNRKRLDDLRLAR